MGFDLMILGGIILMLPEGFFTAIGIGAAVGAVASTAAVVATIRDDERRERIEKAHIEERMREYK